MQSKKFNLEVAMDSMRKAYQYHQANKDVPFV